MKDINIKELHGRYWDFIMKLPPFQGALLIVATISIPIFSITLGTATAIDYSYKTNCLDSPMSRRWIPYVCEEYHDGKWVEIDPSNSKIYYYNAAAGKVGEQ